MQKVRVPVNSFQFGEVSDSLQSRNDTPILASSASRVENFVVMGEGSLKKRHGLKHIYSYSLTYDANNKNQSVIQSRGGLTRPCVCSCHSWQSKANVTLFTISQLKHCVNCWLSPGQTRSRALHPHKNRCWNVKPYSMRTQQWCRKPCTHAWRS